MGRKIRWVVWLPLAGILGFISAFALFSSNVVKKFESAVSESADNTVVLDIQGRSIATVEGLEDRQRVRLPQVSPFLQKAVVAIEDHRFFGHYGVDPLRMLSALVSNIKTTSYGQGASTITQQLVKLTLLTPERKLSRKFKEIWMSFAVERVYNKQELLEFYLNRVYLGNGVYGVEQASRAYFHKSAADLDLSEAVFLAALIKKPEGYLQSLQDEFSAELDVTQLQTLIERYHQTLRVMRSLRWISDQDYEETFNQYPRVYRPVNLHSQVSYFVDEVKKEARRLLNVQRISGRGWRIHTGMDLIMQQSAEHAVSNWINQNPNEIQLGLFAIDIQSGFVRAMIGGRDYATSKFNRTTQARRQTGSAFKPLLYAAALKEGLYPYSIFEDRPFSYYWNKELGIQLKEPAPFNLEDDPLTLSSPEAKILIQEDSSRVYTPRNNQHRYGLIPPKKAKNSSVDHHMTLLRALQRSSNVIAVQLLNQIGFRPLERITRAVGIDIRRNRGLCTALGCNEASLADLTSAYAIFANQGKYHPPRYIQRIFNAQGDTLYQYIPQKPKQILSPWLAFQIRHMLQGVITRGTGWRARLAATPAAGKTGTNDGPRDAWFIGFTPKTAAGIWIGNDNNSLLPNTSGGQAPALIWKEFMQHIIAFQPQETFPIPAQPFQAKELCDIDALPVYPKCPAVSTYYTRPSDPLPENTNLFQSQQAAPSKIP